MLDNKKMPNWHLLKTGLITNKVNTIYINSRARNNIINKHMLASPKLDINMIGAYMENLAKENLFGQLVIDI